MPSLLTEAFEWLDRAEQAREVAGQLADPAARRAVLEPMAALAPAPNTPAQIEAAQVAENVTQTIFTLPYKISVTAGQSLMLPILDRELPARRIDPYQPSFCR